MTSFYSSPISSMNSAPLSTCLEAPTENLVLLSGFTRSGDEIFVESRGEMLVDMSKRRDQLGGEVAGEFVGISRISQELYSIMLRVTAERFTRTHLVDYETDGLVMAARQHPVFCQVVEDLIWSEIDDESQLIRAKHKIYPLLC